MIPLFKHHQLLKKIGLTALTILLVAGGSIWQQRVLQVNAAVQVLLVSRTAIAFGNVFPGQDPSETYTVQLDTSSNGATYTTGLTPLPGLQNLCPFLNISSIDSPAEPDTLGAATLKRPGDTVDNWQVQLSVPGIKGELSQDHAGGIIVQGGNFGCKITITTTTDPGTIIICKNSVGGTGTFNFTGDLGKFSIQTSLPAKNNGVSSNGQQTDPCSQPPCPASDDHTTGSNSGIDDKTKCITNTTVTNYNSSTIINVQNTGAGSGGNVIGTNSGDVNGGKNTSGSATSNSSVTTYGNSINSSVTTGGSNGSGNQIFANLQSGSYTVSESSSTNWSLSSLTCKDPANNSMVSASSAKIQLDSGETVICTFVNEQNTGKIIIRKKTDGGNGSFGFTGNLGQFNITTASGLGSKTFSGLTPGVYTVTEPADQKGWSLTGLTCSDPGGNSQANNRSAIIRLAPGETVTCTFTNSKKGKLGS
ncbi:MAG: hypothetical protein P4L74_07405 [Candidatus Doudnabacteria bacterium]|nr:hypothetical protein [Candidatus Doudnabacteria bacterium]